MKSYDWDYYRHKYVVSDFTLEQLSQFPNAPAFDTIRRRSGRENWPEQRRAYQHNTATKAVEHASTTEAEVAARHARIARALQQKALERLRELPVQALGPKEVLSYLREATAIEREALGLDTTRSDHSKELDAIADALRNPVPPDTLN